MSHFHGHFDTGLELGISGEELLINWQLLSVTQVCISSFSQALSPTLELLYIRVGKAKNREQPMVRTFTSIYLSEEPLPPLGNFAIYRALFRKPMRSSFKLSHVNSPITL
jgi:hypothetical protein